MQNVKIQDSEFRDEKIRSVKRGSDGWEITGEDGWSFWVRGDSPIKPTAGMTARFYGCGIGCTVRGLALDGVTVFYRTAAEEEAKLKRECEERDRERRYDFEKNRAAMDKKYAALPEVFRQRIDRFRANNPNFRWEFEDYEVFCCEQAVAIAKSAIAAAKEGAVAWVRVFADKPWKEQQKAVPELSDGHSGNTFGCACALAIQYIGCAENVPYIRGAMSVVVGSEAYGDIPRQTVKG